MKKPIRVKILLVDDKENNLLSAESILSQDKYQIITASSGREALKILLKEIDFALILMDVEMPDLNGFETAKLIYEREKLRHIPIVFITAHSQGDDNVFEGYKTGAVDYIYKPIRPELLRAKVQAFVDLYRKNRQLMEQEQKLIGINKNLEMEINDRIASEEKVNELNQQLLANISQLEAINKELDCLAYMASHDLQEPLRKIKIFSERLTSALHEDDESKLYLDKIKTACSRMQKLINDIFAFSQITTVRSNRTYSDIAPLLSEVLTDMDFQIQEKNAKIIVGDLPKLHVYPDLIKSLFQNLISNSLKYSQKDTQPVIKISCKTVGLSKTSDEKTKGEKYCRIYVEDNGIGFEQQYAEQVFTIFKRLHSDPERQGTGTGIGIGLAICKKIVEEHQGFISAKSEVGKGTTFIISLPMEAVHEASQMVVV
ncbi:MAG: response regulator [Flavobacteriales bacterium]